MKGLNFSGGMRYPQSSSQSNHFAPTPSLTENSDTLSIVSSILTDDYKPFKPISSTKVSKDNMEGNDSVNYDDSSIKEIENLRAVIKENKAKKLVLEYEVSQKEKSIAEYKEKY